MLNSIRVGSEVLLINKSIDNGTIVVSEIPVKVLGLSAKRVLLQYPNGDEVPMTLKEFAKRKTKT
jgi:hypothetical protein